MFRVCVCLNWLFAAFITASLSAHSQDKKPNVIIIMTDDQGYGEMSRHGNPIIKTPNLDRLGDESLRFVDFHVAPMCTPTRGQLMTGLDAARNGAINVSSGRSLLRPELQTMADIFRENGYKTGLFGKWHLGDNYPYRPGDRGFGTVLWFPSSHIGAVPDFWGNDYFDDTYIFNGQRKKFKGYCTDIFFDEAIRFMKDSKNAGKPFFTYLPTNTPHGPLISKEEDKQAISKLIEETGFNVKDQRLRKDLESYLGMIRNIDENIGKLCEFLKSEDLRENTIVIFLTDNGSTFGHRYFNAGMRGHKTELWEGGHRVPFFLSWPGGNLSSPRDIDGLTQVQDVLPTLKELCKLKNESKFDGVDLSGVLKGKETVDKERMLIINYSRMPFNLNYPSPFSRSILTRDQAGVLWKKWRFLNDKELYNLENDPMQKTNVIGKHPEVVKKMRSHLYQWWDQVKDIANKPQRIIIGHNSENPAMLTACEWLDVFVDQQNQILKGVKKNGFWLLDVSESGTYEFELRRWPKESGAPISGKVKDGKALALNNSKIYIRKDFQFSEENLYSSDMKVVRKPVKPDTNSVTFTVDLEAGPIALHAFFNDGGDTVCGAYYVYVTRK